ncbi:chloride channel protein [Chitinophaga lutea]
MKEEAIPVAPSLELPEPDRTKRSYIRVFRISLQAVMNAVIIGFIARLLVALIHLITNISFYGRFSFEELSPAGNSLGWAVVLVPVAGGLIVGIMARLGSAAIRGHGIPEAMEQVLTNESRIKPIITWLKPLSAAISIGTGGPFGAEGPIIATGGAFGSLAGQIMRISPQERKVMLTAGATAGMAAIFGTPMAALLLAIELLLFEFSPRSVIPVALACATGTAMHYALFESGPVFPMPVVPAPGYTQMLWYVGMGLVIGVLAAGVSKSVYWIEDMFEHLPVHWMFWPAIGAVAVGAVGYFAPYTLGVGYDNITGLLSGSLPWKLVLGLCLLKFISWSVSLGSGTSGGTLAPLLTIGGATGLAMGMLIQQFFPESGLHLPTCALIGMAAMFAGAARALLTAIVFAFECTMQPHGLLPLMGACTGAYFVSFLLMRSSIMTEKIHRRGVATPDAYEPDVLRYMRVSEVMEPATGAVNKGPYVYAGSQLQLAMDLMARYNIERLPVVDPARKDEAIGELSAMMIFRAYSRQKQDGEQYQQAISLKRRGYRLWVSGRKWVR